MKKTLSKKDKRNLKKTYDILDELTQYYVNDSEKDEPPENFIFDITFTEPYSNKSITCATTCAEICSALDILESLINNEYITIPIKE